jgi:hypothetical protein
MHRRATIAGMLSLLALALLQPPATAQELANGQAEPPAADEMEWLHTLGDQTWDFRQLAPTYKPLKGELDPQTGKAVWTLELMKDLTPGEIALQAATQGSPFKPALLDEERILVKGSVRIALSEISGKTGDAIRATFLLPPAETLARVKTIRIERRTQIGF